MSKYLVVGGAGYIGGVCVEKMIDRGDEVVILDWSRWWGGNSG